MEGRRRRGVTLAGLAVLVAAGTTTALAPPARPYQQQSGHEAGRPGYEAAEAGAGAVRTGTEAAGAGTETARAGAGAVRAGTEAAEPRPRPLPAAKQLKVMTFNSWVGGGWLKDPLRKQVAVMEKFKPDVVAMQETRGHAARDLAKKLGWHAWQSSDDLGVVSRYPIERVTGRTSAGAGVRIALPGKQRVELWTAHLYYRPFGAYDACFSHMSGKQIVRREAQSGRVPQMREIMRKLRVRAMIADAVHTPLLLAGDLNSPSYLDWTAATRNSHCGYGPFTWPVSKMIADTGFKDSYRVKHPDPKAQPGNTWSPVYPRHHGSTGRPEPQNRIDYIHYAGPLRVEDSRTVMAGTAKPIPYHKNNTWPSDHRAVLSTFSFE
ncbi:endonuclease/exonuclease/phosphatase family protein [Streptomyces sp. ODS28]|uniref:endonuclease/exonuclease/phosphatase family protein n=1 Tax=Streptomyces sp. ODS28 TaxID=3136688 RepID=UPI0031EF68A5